MALTMKIIGDLNVKAQLGPLSSTDAPIITVTHPHWNSLTNEERDDITVGIATAIVNPETYNIKEPPNRTKLYDLLWHMCDDELIEDRREYDPDMLKKMYELSDQEA